MRNVRELNLTFIQENAFGWRRILRRAFSFYPWLGNVKAQGVA